MNIRFLSLPIALGMVFSALADDSSLSATLAKLRTEYDLPGLGAAKIENGIVKEIAVAGVRKIGDPTLIQVDDAFHLGSCTKAMTATLAAMFVEAGKLKWSSTLTELFPEIHLDPGYAGVTFDMLLAHRAGLTR